MDIRLSKAQLYILITSVLAVLLGLGVGFHFHEQSKKQEEARQQELRRIKSAAQAYVTLIENIENRLSFSIFNYKKVDNELSNLNLLGWQPVEFLCQLITCQYTLETNNKHYVGMPKLTLGYTENSTFLSENSLIIKDIKLSPVKPVVDELFYEKLPRCTSVLTDLRKFIDIASFVLTKSSGNVASFSFSQPTELVKNKSLLKKGRSEPFLDIYGIDWNAEKLDGIKLDYIFRYMSSRENIGTSAVRKIFNSNGSYYNLTGTVYCKVD